VAGLRSLLDETPQSEPSRQECQEPLTEPQRESCDAPESAKEPETSEAAPPVQKPRGSTFLKILAIAACILVVLTVTYAIAGRMFPEWMDQFLYTEEELRILNHRL
jgi:hypothetical protein